MILSCDISLPVHGFGVVISAIQQISEKQVKKVIFFRGWAESEKNIFELVLTYNFLFQTACIDFSQL